ncbi:MAG: hypothetical protein HY615_07775 [Candidatus Rokubacteria bacterium]|nr:hypothetical protein [Candidatus Rokubacteria bacterium]
MNRLILGDSLVVMNSLLQYEGLGGQVQMIYMDPPYGVVMDEVFGSDCFVVTIPIKKKGSQKRRRWRPCCGLRSGPARPSRSGCRWR